jgi:large conductance mechanosensitive channel
MVQEFKDFVNRGNVMDLAVGVIIGGAFGKIVSSLVGDILTPIIGMALNGVDFKGLAVKVGDTEIKYGAFIQGMIDFLIVAFVVFMLVKAVNSMKKPPAPPPPAGPPEDVKLLGEIRDLLAKR